MAKKSVESHNKAEAALPLDSSLASLEGALQAEEPAQASADKAAPTSQAAPAAVALNQDPELLREFLLEGREHLSNIEARLLEFEQGSSDNETLHSAFRSFHTLKGLAGFLEFEVLQEVAHEVETILDRARNGELTITPAIVDVVLSASDYIALWLTHINAVVEGRESTVPYDPADLIRQIRASAAGDQSEDSAEDDEAAPVETAQREESAQSESEPATAAPASDEAAPQEAGKPAARGGAGAQAANTGGRQEEVSVVKVATAKLEYLVDMVGELVIAESLLHHNSDLAGLRSPRVQRDLTHLGRVTAEVQKTAMAMRMVPIGQLFRRMTRLVRDLARKSGKKADLELFGEDVELDRKLVEELADPLVHMIRNSVDHGLEASPQDRLAAGKPETGKVRLAAKHQAGEIHIEISDDGRGLNREKIRRKGIERGLIGPNDQLTDSEIDQLIFRPGFSTAEQITEVSGRGVGMDVVMKNIDRLRGRVEITSQPGKGTKFLLRLPLTLAIIDGLVVLSGEDRYIVPIFSVREMFRPSQDALFTVQGQGEMVLVRERLLPLIRLKRRLGLKSGVDDPCEGLLIVGESDGKQFCLLVDALAGKQEVVIKSLGPSFAHIRGLAGGAILGDGRVGLILDLSQLVGANANGTRC